MVKEIKTAEQAHAPKFERHFRTGPRASREQAEFDHRGSLLANRGGGASRAQELPLEVGPAPTHQVDDHDSPVRQMKHFLEFVRTGDKILQRSEQLDRAPPAPPVGEQSLGIGGNKSRVPMRTC